MSPTRFSTRVKLLDALMTRSRTPTPAAEVTCVWAPTASGAPSTRLVTTWRPVGVAMRRSNAATWFHARSPTREARARTNAPSSTGATMG